MKRLSADSTVFLNPQGREEWMLNIATQIQERSADSTSSRVDERNRLFEIIQERSFSEGETKTLASGKASNFYFDMKRTMSQPEALNLIADLVLDIIGQDECDFVGGLEMGAIPILNAVAMRSVEFRSGRSIPNFWIRKQPKEHGTKSLLEGHDIEELREKTAVMVDDVTTTGKSVLKAIREARKNGLEVTRVITIVDRLEGARENLAKEGIKLSFLFDADDFKTK